MTTSKKNMEKELVCPECGYVGKKERFSKGSYLLEMFLWLMFFVPGALYTTWRALNEYQACPVCKNKAMTPTDGPLGKKIFEERERMKKPIPDLEMFDVVSKIMRQK